MKHLLLLIALLPASAFAKEPTVTLRPSWVFDSWCSGQNKIEVPRAESEKLRKLLPVLQSAWDKDGPAMVKRTESIIGKPFVQNEMIGTVFLCKKTPSMSMPLLINGNWFVKDTPEPTDLVVDIVFHELLHTYLVDNFEHKMDSPLLTKYKNEEFGVLSHLHLMAIQKKVYLELGLKERIAKVIKFDSEIYKGVYKRSWEIVNSEGEDKFIEELK